MKAWTWCCSNWPVVLLALISCTSGPGEAATDWPPDAAEVCRRDLFGDPADLRRVGTEGIALVVRWLDSCELDREVRLSQRGGESAQLTATTAVGASIESQLQRLHEARPEVELKTACQAVVVRPLDAEVEAELLTALISDFRSIRMSPTIEAPLVVHGELFELWVFSGANHSYFQFQSIAGPTGSESPLEAWTHDLVSALGMECD